MQTERDMKILVVDDFAATRKILINTLSQLGYNNTDEADDGYSALVKLKSAIFDFVVLEWNMSKMSGMELLEQIRAVPNLKQIPVLMVTEDVLQENIVAAVKAGAIDYIPKPADADDVENALFALPETKANPPENPMSADRVKWEHIHRVFELCNRNVSETARRLKMHRRTLQRILSKRSPR